MMSAAVIPKITKNQKTQHIFVVFLFPVDIVEKEPPVTVMKSSFSATAGNMHNTHKYQPRSSSHVASFKGFELFVYIHAAASRINRSSTSTSTVSVNSPPGAKLLMCFVLYYLITKLQGLQLV